MVNYELKLMKCNDILINFLTKFSNLSQFNDLLKFRIFFYG